MSEDRLAELKAFVEEHNRTSPEAWTIVEWAIIRIEELEAIIAIYDELRNEQ